MEMFISNGNDTNCEMCVFQGHFVFVLLTNNLWNLQTLAFVIKDKNDPF